MSWAAVSLADKVDTLVGMFAAGEKPTGSRDPYGLRRAAQAVVKILTDLEATTGISKPVKVSALVDQALAGYAGTVTPADDAWRTALFGFLAERQAYLLERRGFKFDEIRAVVGEGATLAPHDVMRRVHALSQARKTAGFEPLAVLFKRVKNITKDFKADVGTPSDFASIRAVLREPAELALLDALEQRSARIAPELQNNRYLTAMNELAHLHAPVDAFFRDVLVMADDPALRQARLALLNTLKTTILQTGGDIAEMAADENR